MTKPKSIGCWNVTLWYPKRVGNVTLIDVYATTRQEAKARALEEARTDPYTDTGKTTIEERGEPLRVTVKLSYHYFHVPDEELT